ncbi:MAG: type II toxin-antitoxin system MqsA family antitoxin [Nitrospirae bacterium]|nr:type II toxin-antitoxin system MqsA family antitoxin [Nitrospirota bacterium]
MTTLECSICNQGTLKKENKDEVFEYQGETITIPDYVVHRCNICSEAIVDNETLKTSGHILKAFKREVDERRV